MKLSKALEEQRILIEKRARELGLDFYPTIFEIVSYDQINQIASYGGFPTRYPHWKFGMEYEQLSKSYEYGLSKIYEMVINNNPVYAYLMDGNSFLDQKLVMAHVFGHADFFKHNVWFKHTDRKMMDTTANHAVRIRRYMDRHGEDKVERFIDQCLSLENLIDRYNPEQIKTPLYSEKVTIHNAPLKVDRDYMRKFVNPEASSETRETVFNPQKDILCFLRDRAPLEDWQADVIEIIRKEAYYFSPQGLTKTMNEGWASYWHSKILTGGILNDQEIVEFADKHSGVMNMPPNGFNPYKIGIELFRDIESRWDKGQFGREWEECDSLKEKNNWDKKLGLGKQKIFEVRSNMSDVAFIDQFLTKDFCLKHGFFVYKLDQRTGRYVVDTTDFKAIKQTLLFKMTNFGQPILSVVHENFENRGELVIKHHHEGMDLQPDYMSRTLENIFKIWKRPVHLETTMESATMFYTFDERGLSSRDKVVKLV